MNTRLSDKTTYRVWLVWTVDMKTSYPELRAILGSEEKANMYKDALTNYVKASNNKNRYVTIEPTIMNHLFGEEMVKELVGNKFVGKSYEDLMRENNRLSIDLGETQEQLKLYKRGYEELKKK